MTDLDTTNLKKTLGDLVALARHIEANPTNIRRRLRELETIHQLLTYYSTPNLRQGALPQVSKIDLTARRCSVEGCQGGPKLWNVTRYNKPDDWRCILHIPKEITFPIGLWGEDWKASGRKEVAIKKEEK